jgi:hypothetical protein
MIGWLLLAVLGMIWAAFLIPSWRRSPTSTVEAFEERMSLLAEANRASPGRWVLVPMKGRRFLGPQDRQRARMRRRRRFLFVALLDLIGLTFLMGLFQPLRSMWVASAILVCLLVVYVVLLIRLRMVEMAEAERSPATASYADAFANGDGHATGSGNGHRNGQALAPAHTTVFVVDEDQLPDSRFLRDGMTDIVEEDVHVIVHRSDEVDVAALRAASGSSSP